MVTLVMQINNLDSPTLYSPTRKTGALKSVFYLVIAI